MKYKDLFYIEYQLSHIREKLKEGMLLDSPTPDEITSLGLENYLTLEIDRFINTYEYLKDLLEKYYFQEEPDFNLKKEVLYVLGEQGQFPKTLPVNLSKMLVDHFHNFTQIQTLINESEYNSESELEKNDEDFEDYEYYEDDDIVEYDIKIETIKIVSERLNLSVDKYTEFRKRLVELANKEKYGLLLDTIFN
jgi:hypothetical protein